MLFTFMAEAAKSGAPSPTHAISFVGQTSDGPARTLPRRKRRRRRERGLWLHRREGEDVRRLLRSRDEAALAPRPRLVRRRRVARAHGGGAVAADVRVRLPSPRRAQLAVACPRQPEPQRPARGRQPDAPRAG